MPTLPVGQGLTELFTRSSVLGPDLGDLTGIFPGLDSAPELVPSSFDGTDPWDQHLFSPLSLEAPPVSQLGTENHKLSAMHGSSPSPDDKDPVGALNAELTALNSRTVLSMRSLILPGGAPLTVNSPVVNDAFEATTELIRIINTIAHISVPKSHEDHGHVVTDGRSSMTSGLVFLSLAVHQHLLGLFRAICNSVERCLDSISSSSKSQQRGLHGEGPSSAQFVMVLQLLIHLIGRMDRSLFSNTMSLTGENQGSSADSIVSGYMGGDSWDSEGSQCVIVLAQAIVETLPEEHVKLKDLIQLLLKRMEGSDVI
ncbi:uncharacterized protein E0L32_006039 [Thyridium curvatum]|uniref:Uncharacterized protein n=1 Tax=Thyridium curvatum TaxID=1093900 RepID=A0A507B9W0_9PEZI|nr:uncharacterized protein E0L32_006039 [Thyridium curvatum]TPX13568.1 hypothetical protein E0L32_006039 [Thyridium curvatum]